jgi:hypothetical protein
MKLAIVAFAGLMMMGATFAVTAQDTPVNPVPQQNDRRAAIARVNPNKPIQVRVISRTTIPVVSSMPPQVGDRPIAPGQSTTFGRLHTSYLSLPMDLQVSLKNSPAPDNPIGLFLDVKTAGNEIIVSVRTSTTGSGNSSQTVNVDPKGLVYVF